MTIRRLSTVGGIAAILALAVTIRVTLLRGSGWLLEGDDSLSALMGVAILSGDRPLMLKNQTYASAWEPYAMALSYLAFGISRVSAKLPALVGSVALIGVTTWLARVVAGRTAGWLAAVLVALPPAYALVLWLKPWAPYTEVILFGTVCLIAAIKLARPCSAIRDARWSLVCGVCGGLALWMHPLAVSYLLAAGLTLLAWVRSRQRWSTIGPLGLLGFALGGLPIWIFNLQTGGATLRFIASGTSGQTADRGAVFGGWWNNDLPRGAGLWHPWGDSPAVFGVLMAVILSLLLWAVVGRRSARLRPLDSVLLLLVLMPMLLVVSGFGGPALNPYGFDATGRYAPPLWAGLAVVLGASLATLWRCKKLAALVIAALPLALNLLAVRATDPVAAFQSPYWNRLPVDNRPLLAVLSDEDVHDVWMNHWAGQPLMFDARASGQALIAYDWYDVQAGGIDRFPEYRSLVEEASRPAFVLVTDEPEPELERVLRSLGVAFVERRAPPYVVVIPTSRVVSPSEVTNALDYRY